MPKTAKMAKMLFEKPVIRRSCPFLVVVTLGAALVGCSGAGDTTRKVVKNLNPVNWFGDDEKEKEKKPLQAGKSSPARQSFPRLGDVPSRPKKPTPEEQTQEIAEGLAADTENAKYSDQQLRQSAAVFGGRGQPQRTIQRSQPVPWLVRRCARQRHAPADRSPRRLYGRRTCSGAPTVRAPTPTTQRSALTFVCPNSVTAATSYTAASVETSAATAHVRSLRRRHRNRVLHRRRWWLQTPSAERAQDVHRSADFGAAAAPSGATSSNTSTASVAPTPAVVPPPKTQTSTLSRAAVPSASSGFATPIGRPSTQAKPPPVPQPLRGPAGAQTVAVAPPRPVQLSRNEQTSRPQATVPKSIQVGTIYFGDGSASLSREDVSIISAVRQAFGQTGGKIRVVGHSSMSAKALSASRREEVNFRMSLRRANAVADELIRNGVPRQSVEVIAEGDRAPAYEESSRTGPPTIAGLKYSSIIKRDTDHGWIGIFRCKKSFTELSGCRRMFLLKSIR